ncbi:YciI family protein [Nakamurella deserti]|uniref:YciI family protein n=1 Tax=Nakamurella deserti TaxID=2164074 RepID=UPI000DBE98BE|nr:YciI family protein [Nakamurella deserti]
MRYTLLLHYPEMSPEELGPEGQEYGQRAFAAYADALSAAGVLLSAEVLQPSASTTTVRTRDGRLHIQDGPYADTKEQLGGSFVVDVPDLDAALGWAQQAPSVEWGAVEVRPGAVFYADGAWRPNA